MLTAKQYGYSLLEVLLALALATTSLLAAQQLWQGYWQRTQWWQLVAQVSVRKIEIVDSLQQLHGQRCAAGLLHGAKQQWRLHLDLGKGCQAYDLRFNETNSQLQRRRSGGRYTGFLSDIRQLQVRYGLAASDGCTPQVWLEEVPSSQAGRVVLMQVSMQLAIKGGGQLLALPEVWQLEQVQSSQVVWVPVTTLVSLGCDGDE